MQMYVKCSAACPSGFRDYGLLSFGDEAEEDEEETVAVSKVWGSGVGV